MNLRRLSGQSTAEYAVILAVVIGAAVAMQVYFKRGLQARQKMAVDAFTGVDETFAGIDADNSASLNLGTTSQYEPYYAKSGYDRYQENVEQEKMTGGTIVKKKVSDLTATTGSQGQATAKGRDESMWK